MKRLMGSTHPQRRTTLVWSRRFGGTEIGAKLGRETCVRGERGAAAVSAKQNGGSTRLAHDPV